MRFFHELPLIAILRGLQPAEAVAVGQALYDAGFRVMEVPLNSPEPLESIARLSAEFGQRALIGAGTVVTANDVSAVAAAGGRLIVSPNTDPSVIAVTKKLGMISAPGAATPSEAFSALAHGADILKLFPAEGIPPVVVKAWHAVLPKGTRLVAVGGITPENMGKYLAAGVTGFGLGTGIYKPGMSPDEVRANAGRFLTAWRTAADKRQAAVGQVVRP